MRTKSILPFLHLQYVASVIAIAFVIEVWTDRNRTFILTVSWCRSFPRTVSSRWTGIYVRVTYRTLTLWSGSGETTEACGIRYALIDSRIVEVRTHKQPYRNSLSIEPEVREIGKCSWCKCDRFYAQNSGQFNIIIWHDDVIWFERRFANMLAAEVNLCGLQSDIIWRNFEYRLRKKTSCCTCLSSPKKHIMNYLEQK